MGPITARFEAFKKQETQFFNWAFPFVDYESDYLSYVRVCRFNLLGGLPMPSRL